ncbi:MAG: hypothetical protein CBC62_04210, partial [Opitutia bacterium TMED102]
MTFEPGRFVFDLAQRMRNDELQSILNGTWQRLSKAVNDSADPWRLPTLGTQGLNGPSARTIVLRSADAANRVVTAQTDIRSTKIPGFRKDPRVAWLFFDPTKQEQVRATGRAVIHHYDDITRRAWPSVPESNQINYATAHSPGTAIEDPALGQATSNDLAKAYENFAVIRCEITAIDWL